MPSAANASHATSADQATSASSATTACTANAAFSTFHDAAIALPNSFGAIATLTIPAPGNYVVNAKFGAPGQVVLRCTDVGAGDVYAFDTKITAVQVAQLTNTPF